MENLEKNYRNLRRIAGDWRGIELTPALKRRGTGKNNWARRNEVRALLPKMMKKISLQVTLEVLKNFWRILKKIVEIWKKLPETGNESNWSSIVTIR